MGIINELRKLGISAAPLSFNVKVSISINVNVESASVNCSEKDDNQTLSTQCSGLRKTRLLAHRNTQIWSNSTVLQNQKVLTAGFPQKMGI